MAPPPGKKPEAKKVTDVDAVTRIIGILVILAIIASVVAALAKIVNAPEGSSAVGAIRDLLSRTGILEFLYRIAHGAFFWVSMLISVVFAAGALYSFFQYKKIRDTHKAEIRMLEAKLTEDASGVRNERWERIHALASSDNPGDWRVAIIEADVMLHEFVKGLGHHGDTLGDMLKGIEKSDFTTLDLAWEAHKVRNLIAHHGSDFILTNREAKRVVDLYRQVFGEFDVI